MTTLQRKITDGPGKFDLMLSLMEGHEVQFTIDGFGKQRVEVLGGQVTDRESESWSFDYRLLEANDQSIHRGTYSCTKRKGFTSLPDDAIPRIPQNGDPAYCWYHGHKWVGVLDELRNNNSHMPDWEPRWLGAVVPANAAVEWGYHSSTRGLYVGYDGPIVWDAEAGMWNAHADHD